MPTLELLVDRMRVADLTEDGNLPLDPPLPGLPRVLLRRLSCLLRVPPTPGARRAVIDTGAPLSVFPHDVWSGTFRWQPGRDYDVLAVAGVDGPLRGRVLNHKYTCRLVRLRVPVVLAGRDARGPRFTLDGLVAQLAEPGGPPYVILGLWGGVFEGRRLAIDRLPDSDDIRASLES